jgi:hypothetical protein
MAKYFSNGVSGIEGYAVTIAEPKYSEPHIIIGTNIYMYIPILACTNSNNPLALAVPCNIVDRPRKNVEFSLRDHVHSHSIPDPHRTGGIPRSNVVPTR